MPRTPKIYTKLSGFSIGMWGYAQLWSGPDHLMEVTAYGFSERYRRFYWREIEAVLVRRTAVRLIWNLISGGFAALSLGGLAWSYHYFRMLSVSRELGGFLNSMNVPSRAFGEAMLGILMGICGVVAVIGLLVLLVNTLLGPRCVCILKMPAGVERLAAPTRLPAAARVLEKIAPLIEIAQTGPIPDLPQ